MFEIVNRQSYKSIPNYFNIWTTLTDYSKPSVLVATKADLWQVAKVKQKAITYHRKKNLQFYNVSSRAGYNLLKPF